jgi:hypothetical protein
MTQLIFRAVMKEVRRMLGKEDENEDPSLYPFKAILKDFTSSEDVKIIAALAHFKNLLGERKTKSYH